VERSTARTMARRVLIMAQTIADSMTRSTPNSAAPGDGGELVLVIGCACIEAQCSIAAAPEPQRWAARRWRPAPHGRRLPLGREPLQGGWAPLLGASSLARLGAAWRTCYSTGMPPDTLKAVVHSDPETMGGTPVFVGTRVPVQNLIDYLEGGESIEDFLDAFPSVKRNQVIAVIEAAKLKVLESLNAV